MLSEQGLIEGKLSSVNPWVTMPKRHSEYILGTVHSKSQYSLGKEEMVGLDGTEWTGGFKLGTEVELATSQDHLSAHASSGQHTFTVDTLICYIISKGVCRQA